jgi:uncharacterized membrane protein
MENFHQLNIWIHVVTGSLALLTGFVLLFGKKGGRFHKKWGRVFLWLLGIVIVTGLLGVLVFGRNTFLLVITVLAGYMGFSGYRVLKNQSNRVYLIDLLVPVAALLITGYFLYYIKSIGMIWAPVIIYSVPAVLMLAVLYDLGRYFIPADRYKKVWLYEHMIKMVHAFGALLSAFSGTVFKDYQPYSQLLPSVLGYMIIAYFVHRLNKKH